MITLVPSRGLLTRCIATHVAVEHHVLMTMRADAEENGWRQRR